MPATTRRPTRLLSSFSRRLGLVLCLVFTALLVASGCGRSPRFAPLPAGSLVVAFGDSVTYGTGAGAGEDYPARLAALTGWEVVNAGVPGEVSEEALARLPTVLADRRPALVLVELGGNDFLHRIPERQVRERLGAIVARIREGGAVPVLVAVPRPTLVGAASGHLGDAPLYADLGRETATPVVEDVLARVLSDESLRADPIHPNARGYERLAAGIADALTQTGLLARH